MEAARWGDQPFASSPPRPVREAGVDKAVGPSPKASCSGAVGHLLTPGRFGAAAWRDREGPGFEGMTRQSDNCEH